MEETNNWKDNWFVVYTASNSHFVGKAVGDMVLGERVTLAPCYNWINESVMVDGGRMSMVRQAIPMGPTLESSILAVIPIGYQSVSIWDDDTKAEFFASIEALDEGMKQAQQRKKSRIITPQGAIDPRILKDLRG
jgi:hypothetical protein